VAVALCSLSHRRRQLQIADAISAAPVARPVAVVAPAARGVAATPVRVGSEAPGRAAASESARVPEVLDAPWRSSVQ
jgi:hypothetical protein